ncbi:ATP-dependent zinc metalloprotease FtsH [bacterium]|nr:ATP-dependent zinc metalloprotease FtsH [bacterium]
MKSLFKNILIAFIIFLVIASIFSLTQEIPNNKAEKISFSQLAEQINDGRVKRVLIKGNKLNIELKNGRKEVAYKEVESSFTQSLKNYGISPEKIKEIEIDIKEESNLNFWLGVVIPFLLPTIIILIFFWMMLKGARHGQTQVFSFGKTRARLFTPETQKEKVTFDDVANLKEAKEELQEIVEFLKDPKKFIKLGAKIPKGVLLIGAPGTGKTLLARAVANEASVPFFAVSGSEFIELFVGVGSSRIRDLFRTAKKHTPCLVFIDEIESIGRQRGHGIGGGYEEREQTLNQLLSEMDGFEPNNGIIVLAATNQPSVLDPALLRPGRFDRRIILDEPDIKAREEILKIHTRNKKLAKNVNLKEIAERTPGFTGADLANLTNEAALLAAKRNKKQITQDELRECIEKILLGPERKSHILSKKEKEIAAYHEAGHALVNASLSHTDPVHKVSIISRGKAAGYTLKLPEEDKHLRTKSEFIDELAVLLGGYVAEELVFNELTTGASSDLEIASNLARKLVTQYGMSKLGPITYGRFYHSQFLDQEYAIEKNYSEKVATQIDEEVKKLIDSAYNTAKKILTRRRRTLNKLAKILIEKETIERKEFMKIVGRRKIKI